MIGIDDLKCKKILNDLNLYHTDFQPEACISPKLTHFNFTSTKKTGGYITPHHKIVRLDVYRLDQGRIYLDEDETPKETLTDNTKQHQTVPGHMMADFRLSIFRQNR